MDDIQKLYVGSESLDAFIDRSIAELIADGWTRTVETRDAEARVWIPPWDAHERCGLGAAVQQRNQRFLSAWILAGKPEGDEFYELWVAARCPWEIRPLDRSV